MLKFFLSALFLFWLTDSDNPIAYIHEPYRLYLMDPNKTVIGVVKSVNKSIDGDINIRLAVTDYSLLTKNNIKKEDSCLVLEIVCGCKSVFKVCDGYINQIPIPNVGDTIKVTGLYVYDKRHKINEIHPVLKLVKIPG